MGREFHVRFREGLGVQFPQATRLVVFCESREDALRVKDQLLPPWLAERGLTLAEEKTRVVHLTEGFDFLGCTVRHYPAPGTSRTGHKLLITPSKKATARKRQELREEWARLSGHNVRAVLRRLNPIIRGWANYYRAVVASRAFARMDDWMQRRAARYAKRRHPNKPWSWCKGRYWGRLNPERKDRWVFGDKPNGAYLLKFRWFKIVRHHLVRGRASPDDPSLRGYWWARRKIDFWSFSDSDVRLAEQQDWCCPVCGMELLNGEELQRHHKQPRCQGGTNASGNREIVHLYCHQQRHAVLRQERQVAGGDERSG
jgi:RNA-directed DNA polymerase